jgi:acyl-coenzyme A synthetase/AMP-(fatty) acid ligase
MDGSVTFLGRKDTQVKVRGMRVELGAVEQHFSSDGLVRLAVAVVPDHGVRKNRLVAVLSLAAGDTSEPDGDLNPVEFGDLQAVSELDLLRQSVRGVRGRLKLTLPGYMIPSSWFVLRSFPLRPSGKIDRRKLKEWIDAMDTQTTDRIECLLDKKKTATVLLLTSLTQVWS